VLGAHLEGPFPSPPDAARRTRLTCCHDLAALSRLVHAARATLRSITIAPELPGALTLIDELVVAGIVVAVGNTDATYETTRLAFDHGATDA
jgi:N-acetylglucosamine-6-phosphate deacetylase